MNTASEPINLNGTWKILVHKNGDSSEIPANEFAVFDDAAVSVCRDGEDNSVLTSAYVIESSESLMLSDIPRRYVMKKITENIIMLADSKTTALYLVRWPGESMTTPTFNASLLQGKFKVICHSGNTMINEELLFAADKLDVFRDGAAEPMLTSDISVKDGVLSVDKLGSSFLCTAIGEKTIVMVDVNTGDIWEFRAE